MVKSYRYTWRRRHKHYEATIHINGLNSPAEYEIFPIGTEPSEMAAWAKKEIQLLKLKDLVMP